MSMFPNILFDSPDESGEKTRKNLYIPRHWLGLIEEIMEKMPNSANWKTLADATTKLLGTGISVYQQSVLNNPTGQTRQEVNGYWTEDQVTLKCNIQAFIEVEGKGYVAVLRLPSGKPLFVESKYLPPAPRKKCGGCGKVMWSGFCQKCGDTDHSDHSPEDGEKVEADHVFSTSNQSGG